MPKDGPSAGITMATALVSALTKMPVRKDVAMTGEITLRGRVLPIGGLKEKALAAHRAEIKKIIIPRENEKDIEEVPKSVVEEMQFILVDHLDEVLRHALEIDDADEFFAKARRELEAVEAAEAASKAAAKHPQAVTPGAVEPSGVGEPH